MLRVTNKKASQKRNTRVRGICAAAESLGVSRTHLSLVLHGKRQSRILLKRYRALANFFTAKKPPLKTAA